MTIVTPQSAPQSSPQSTMVRDLKSLDLKIAEMGGLVETQLRDAIKALVEYNPTRAKQIAERDLQIDQLEREIDELTIKFLADHRPVGEQLRRVVAGLKMSSNLERMGDYAKNIAKRTIVLSSKPIITSSTESIQRMAQTVQSMIKHTLDAWLQWDVDMPRLVIEMDEGVDRYYTSLFKEILTYSSEDMRQMTSFTHLLFIAKNVERIGDHTTNIAEQVYFALTGQVLDDFRDKSDEIAITAKEDATAG